jgi:hypothetical protein
LKQLKNLERQFLFELKKPSSGVLLGGALECLAMVSK